MPTVTSPTFSDVDPSDPAMAPYWPYVEALVAAEVTGGTDLGPPRLYSPSSSVTHSQLRVFASRAKHYNDKSFEMEAAGPELFVDVPIGHWAFGFVQRMALWGMDGGPERLDRTPGALGENTAVTRGQAAVVLVRAVGELPLDDKLDATFTDVPVGHAKFGYVEQLYALRVTAGVGGGLFGVDTTMTRAQMAVFIVKLFKLPFVTPNPPEQ